MALADYRLCDVCQDKAFYDSELSYDFKEYPDTGLYNVGAWGVLCRDCIKTHRVVILPVEVQHAPAGVIWSNEWRPIETAPKDGTLILLWTGREAVVSRWYVHYLNGKPDTRRAPEWEQPEMYGGFGGYQGPLAPTHWMPRPPAPETS